MPEPKEAPVTVTGLAKYVPLVASGAIALAVSAFGWGVTYATLTSDVATLKTDVTALKSDVTTLTGRVDKIADDVAQPELSRRLERIEELVEHLVCLDDRADKELCRRALSKRGQ